MKYRAVDVGNWNWMMLISVVQEIVLNVGMSVNVRDVTLPWVYK